MQNVRSPTLISDPSFSRRSGFTDGGGAGKNQRVSRAFFSKRGASSSKIAIFAPVAFRMDSSSAVGSGWPCVFRTTAILAPCFSARPNRSSPANAGSTTAPACFSRQSRDRHCCRGGEPRLFRAASKRPQGRDLHKSTGTSRSLKMTRPIEGTDDGRRVELQLPAVQQSPLLHVQARGRRRLDEPRGPLPR